MSISYIEFLYFTPRLYFRRIEASDTTRMPWTGKTSGAVVCKRPVLACETLLAYTRDDNQTPHMARGDTTGSFITLLCGFE